MADVGRTSPATEREPSDARAALEALAKTLPLTSLKDFAVDATLRRGTLLVARPQPIPATRGEVERASSESVTLPRMDVSMPGDPSIPEIADLELLHALGEGGMGVVWLARQRSLERDVAVKRLKRGAPSADAASLLAEARATGALEHPSIVPVHALGVDGDGSPLLVMKRIEGDSLDALLKDAEHHAWPDLLRRYGDRVAAIAEILMRVADALELAHARGIVHRDVKPENVMVGRFGEVYLVDWGIALRPEMLDDEERRSIGIVGTPSFMAPEMVRGDARAIDARTDVYLLGATLHAALSGEARHAGDTLPNVLLAALASQPVDYPPEHGELGALANRATHPDKAERPPSALAFREALSDFLRHRTSTRLAEEARARLEAIAGADATPAALASPEATRALTESRFAFTQALREWSGNTAARAGLERTLRWMIEAELHRRSPDAAEALLREIEGGDAALVARIDGVRALLDEARQLEEAARSEAREKDPARTAQQRAWIAGGLMVLTSVLVALGWSSEAAHAGARPMSEVLVYDAVLVGFVAAAVVLFRKQLLANRLGRQTAMSLVALLVLGGVSDVFFYWSGSDPNRASASSMLVMASVLLGAAIGIDARFLWSAAAFLAGAVVCALAPTLTVPAIGAAAIAATSVVLVDSIRQARTRT